jgi:hypothetical protein
MNAYASVNHVLAALPKFLSIPGDADLKKEEQLASRILLPQASVSTIDAKKAISLYSSYIAASFDQVLTGKSQAMPVLVTQPDPDVILVSHP